MCEPCSIACLQIVCGEGSTDDTKSLVKGANSYLKAVILTLMEKVFNGVSEKTRAERWDDGKSGFKARGRKYREVKVEVKNENEAKMET